MNRLITTLFILGAVCVLLTTTAHAVLVDRGGGMIYDTDLDVTWLQDANFCTSNPTDPACVLAGANASGQMNWTQANTWADNLVYGGFEDWRLPTSQVGGCTGLDCTDNEMGHLLYVELQIGTINEDFSTISNRQRDWYWSGTANPAESRAAWSVTFVNGFASDGNFKSNSFHAMAVRDGDVVPQITLVEVDIKPGRDPNSINLCSNGSVPVAILGSATFNVYDVVTSTLRFAEAAAKVVGKKDPHELCSYDDVNNDSYTDLVCKYVTTDIAGVDGESTTATVNGELLDDTPFKGTDSVNIVKDTCN